MCGRFVATAPPSELADYFQAVLSESATVEQSQPSYNVAPTNHVHSIRANDGHRQLETMKWGLVPSWAKDPKIGSRMINARAETVATKPAFRSTVKKRRCLIPADGFYEWQKIGGQKTKQPYYITRTDGEPIVFAGLWEAWKPKDQADQDWTISCTLLTTDPNAEMQTIHHRMPVLVPPTQWDRWLDPANGAEDVADLMVPGPDGLLTLTPVTTMVNNVRNKGPELIDPSS